MAANRDEVVIVVSAKDFASATLKKLTREFKKLGGTAALMANKEVRKLERNIRSLGGGAKKARPFFSRFVRGIALGNIAANAATKAMGLLKDSLGQFVEATKVAARIQVMNRVFLMTGRNAGLSKDALLDMKQEVMDLGIAEKEAIQIGQRFIQAQLNIADATKIARAAQDLAVIAGTNSSETAIQLTEAIVKQRPILLKQFGIIANLNDIYGSMADVLGKTSDSLTKSEKRTAFLNEILKQAKTVAGSYESAMKDVGKQLTSLPRHFQNAQNAVGKIFLPAMGVAVRATKDFLVSIKTIADALNNDLSVSFEKMRRNADKLSETEQLVSELSNEYETLIAILAPTADEQDRLAFVTEQLAEIIPGAVTEWNEYGKAVKISEDKIVDFIEAQERAARTGLLLNLRDLRREYEDLATIDVAAKTIELNKAQEELNKFLERRKTNPTAGIIDPGTKVGQVRDRVKELAATVNRLSTELAAVEEAKTKLVFFGTLGFKNLTKGTEEYRTALIILGKELTEDILARQQKQADAETARLESAQRVSTSLADMLKTSLAESAAGLDQFVLDQGEAVEVATKGLAEIVVVAERSGREAFDFLMKNFFDPMKNQNKKVTKDIASEWRRSMGEIRSFADLTAVSMISATDRSVESIVGNFKILRERSKTIFGQMAQDFIREFINRILKALIASAIFKLFTIFSGGTTSFGDIFKNQLLGTPIPGSPGAPALAPAFASAGPLTQSPQTMNIFFSGPVTSESFVNDSIIPALEAAIGNGATDIQIGNIQLTGRENVII